MPVDVVKLQRQEPVTVVNQCSAILPLIEEVPVGQLLLIHLTAGSQSTMISDMTEFRSYPFSQDLSLGNMVQENAALHVAKSLASRPFSERKAMFFVRFGRLAIICQQNSYGSDRALNMVNREKWTEDTVSALAHSGKSMSNFHSSSAPLSATRPSAASGLATDFSWVGVGFDLGKSAPCGLSSSGSCRGAGGRVPGNCLGRSEAILNTRDDWLIAEGICASLDDPLSCAGRPT